MKQRNATTFSSSVLNATDSMKEFIETQPTLHVWAMLQGRHDSHDSLLRMFAMTDLLNRVELWLTSDMQQSQDI